ncbi:Gfo/Idh/MocA family protein [Streptococcus macacae]|uniref:Dihydrodipicolinate reductase domain protein n=1 Tax=Streptococcus macacae NCTC 11558 TaxID=764298 RepID=G5JUQ5_9STRE|nr:Gfo/Idh/MocA family oxidoreductase [Streptococcus macacae]EHJ53264.1 dihydrodipicolinate reductase domain protein [Streptococcus macacae NCTC 11558]SUN78869.1 oxidoreductase [Streptococcus macacae NCTC 11558]
MLNLGIIGTGTISHQFIEAAQLTQQYHLKAVYSRQLERAQNFLARYETKNLACYDDLKAFLASDFDILYLASPNALHYQHAKAALEAGKHLIVEKPAFSTPQELEAILKLAEEKSLYFFEAARNYHEDSLAVIKQFLADKTVVGANFSYIKYSSKMKDLLAGKMPNVFSDKFSGGALVDLGIYPIYAALKLFGKPKSVNYTASQLANSIDLNGNGNLIYPHFHIALRTGKNYDALNHAEIYTRDGTLILNHIQGISSAHFRRHDGSRKELTLPEMEHLMSAEAKHFADMLNHKNETLYQTWLEDARSASQILYQMRQSAGIVFEADNK